MNLRNITAATDRAFLKACERLYRIGERHRTRKASRR